MYEDVFAKLEKSDFRRKFKLKETDKKYIAEKGLDVIKSHARDFISKRIAPAYIPNDGKQTATCCRGCINKWHKFPIGVDLTQTQQDYLVDLIMCWIEKQL